MDKLKAIFVSMMVVMISMGCAPRRAAEPYNPFKIDAVQFHSRVKTIALAPIRLPEGMPEAEAIKSQFEASIEKELRQAGYHVIPSRTYKEVEERKAREAGGYYDIKTGAPDEEKYKSVQQQVRKELHITHQAEGFLYSAVRIVPVRFMGGTVFWHGTQETISK
ncbi:MAG: hypothetical protein FJY85_25945, partial [Deltaproteobacteria bacterium]|nr:hypothetical protein [Deltaproteobacteria bacterium]